MDYEEEPEYTLESLFSDIGGAAGLALGMSLATFFGAQMSCGPAKTADTSMSMSSS